MTSRARIALLLAPVALIAAGAASARAAIIAPSQQLVVLVSAHQARSAPASGSTARDLVPATTPITGARTELPVIGRSGDWLDVMLPGRPNGRTGWISRSATVLTTTQWHIVVDASTRRVTVYRAGRAVKVFAAVVGAPATPTPRGTFFVEESVALSGKQVGGPFALALSARSDVLQEFAGGPGQIALHGLDNIGGVLGTAASHGCVRLADSSMRWLAARIGPGVPVTVVG
jgi:lipoprotein-anchoring transpeptidase ErfK/SrfK